MLTKNKFTELPIWLAKLPSIKLIRATQNPLTFPPYEIAYRDEVLQYLKKKVGDVRPKQLELEPEEKGKWELMGYI